MRLQLLINGRPETVELLAGAPDCRFRVGDGAERHADVRMPEPGAYSVLLDGRVREARVETRPGAMVVTIDGFRFEVEVRDPLRPDQYGGARTQAAGESVTAPMPARVVRVMVQQGDEVEAGQGLVVLEAMKMQSELKASRRGRVTALRAAEGQAVAAGELLVTLA